MLEVEKLSSINGPDLAGFIVRLRAMSILVTDIKFMLEDQVVVLFVDLINVDV